MLVKRKITVKAVVTEEYKRRLLAQLQQALQKVELSLQQLDFQGRKYLAEVENADPAQMAAFREKLERQRKRQEQIRGSLSDRLSVVRQLGVGSEHAHAVLDGFAEVKVGDNLAEKLGSAELVIEDDVIVEIRGA